ncbi:MAG: hypothetical protein PHO56_03875 [Patescibacteria group bacterium]|nr:hypothetical protein [Patescibacteria group bacterium]
MSQQFVGFCLVFFSVFGGVLALIGYFVWQTYKKSGCPEGMPEQILSSGARIDSVVENIETESAPEITPQETFTRFELKLGEDCLPLDRFFQTQIGARLLDEIFPADGSYGLEAQKRWEAVCHCLFGSPVETIATKAIVLADEQKTEPAEQPMETIVSELRVRVAETPIPEHKPIIIERAEQMAPVDDGSDIRQKIDELIKDTEPGVSANESQRPSPEVVPSEEEKMDRQISLAEKKNLLLQKQKANAIARRELAEEEKTMEQKIHSCNGDRVTRLLREAHQVSPALCDAIKERAKVAKEAAKLAEATRQMAIAQLSATNVSPRDTRKAIKAAARFIPKTPTMADIFAS